jgi:hypothetical protein
MVIDVTLASASVSEEAMGLICLLHATLERRRPVTIARDAVRFDRFCDTRDLGTDSSLKLRLIGRTTMPA